jgi:hypothetical protein
MIVGFRDPCVQACAVNEQLETRLTQLSGAPAAAE